MKILLVCESFSPKPSGGKAARYLFQILTDAGHDVRVTITSPSDANDRVIGRGQYDAIPAASNRRYYWRMYEMFNPHAIHQGFKDLVDEFAPDVVHFASFDHSKPTNLYRYCKTKNIRVVLQPWTMHFYCAQGYGFKDNGICAKCIDDGPQAAITQGCVSPRGVISQIERNSLRSQAFEADAVLSSNSDLDGLLERYGVDKDRIHRFPIPFDVSGITETPTTKGSYYIYYGQAASHKGINFLLDIFSELPEKTLRIYPMAAYAPARKCSDNVKIMPGIGWNNGLREAIAGSFAVLLPSLWMTPTEYSLCEALVMKKPVVAFNVGAHKNILANRNHAMIVDAQDMVQFKAAMYELERDPVLYERLATGGLARIKELNSPEKLHSQLMKIYLG